MSIISTPNSILTASGPTSGVDSASYGNAEEIHLATRSDGSFIVVWSTQYQSLTYGQSRYSSPEDFGIYAQIFGADLTPITTAIRVDPVSDWPGDPEIIVNADDSFLISWSEGDASVVDYPSVFFPTFAGQYAQMFMADGSRAGAVLELLPALETSLTQQRSSLISLGEDSFALIWIDVQDQTMRGQIYSTDGTPLDEPLDFGPSGATSSADPAVAPLQDGGFMIASQTSSGEGNNIIIRSYDSSGLPVGSDVVANTSADYARYDPAITGLPDGGFFVSWTTDGQDGEYGGIFGRRFGADGTPTGDEIAINTQTQGEQNDSNVTLLPTGDLLVTWVSTVVSGEWGFAQDFVTGRILPADGSDGAGEFVVRGGRYNETGGYNEIDGHDQVVLADGTVVNILGDSGDYPDWLGAAYWNHPTLSLQEISTRFNGTLEDDEITGAETNDELFAEAGNDLVYAGAGNDLIYGGQGQDILYGEAGDDTIHGGSDYNKLHGGEGNDLILGGSIRDEVTGGSGNDSIQTYAGNDLVYGQDGNDTIAGGTGVDVLVGQNGNDVIGGGAYSDELFGGDGFDFINGGFGHDRINGGADADQFYHLGIADHGSDWIQDYNAADGDVLQWGGATATADDFQINTADTANAGVDGVSESFVIYRPTGQIMWALVDGDAQSQINIQIAGQAFDLMA
jgi:Ca2+-binding RTX toxin-like protein